MLLDTSVILNNIIQHLETLLIRSLVPQNKCAGEHYITITSSPVIAVPEFNLFYMDSSLLLQDQYGIDLCQ